jgi:hypothetical protein
MPNTYTLIASSTVGAGGASSIDFTSIPATYTDLLVVHSLRGTQTAVYQQARIQFNGDTGSNYTYKYLEGSGASAYSGGGTSTSTLVLGNTCGNGATANTFGNGQFYIPNYTSSNQKSVSVETCAETNASTQYMDLIAGLWTGTSAITSIKLYPDSTYTWLQYSTAYLYGIKNS